MADNGKTSPVYVDEKKFNAAYIVADKTGKALSMEDTLKRIFNAGPGTDLSAGAARQWLKILAMLEAAGKDLTTIALPQNVSARVLPYGLSKMNEKEREAYEKNLPVTFAALKEYLTLTVEANDRIEKAASWGYTRKAIEETSEVVKTVSVDDLI